jgi:hypothetical protein
MQTGVGWGDAVAEWILGFRKLSDVASWERATLLSSCHRKSTVTVAAIALVRTRLPRSPTIQVLTERRGKEFRNDANGHDSMLRVMNPVMHARDVHRATSVQELRMLTSSVLLSHGMSPSR